MKLILRRRKREQSERGGALVEFAIVVPFLVFLVVSMIELGMLIEQYMHVVNISRDSARQAAQVINHEQDQWCRSTTETPGTCVQGLVPHARAWYLLNEFATSLDLEGQDDPANPFDPEDGVITESYLTGNSPGTNPRDSTVDFIIRGNFVTVWGIRIPVNVHSSVGYSFIPTGT